MSRDDFGVEDVLRAADAVEWRCAGACLEHVDSACVRWVDVVPRRNTAYISREAAMTTAEDILRRNAELFRRLA